MPLPNSLESDIRGESLLHLNGECSASLVIANMQSWACGECPRNRHAQATVGFSRISRTCAISGAKATNLVKQNKQFCTCASFVFVHFRSVSSLKEQRSTSLNASRGREDAEFSLHISTSVRVNTSIQILD